VAREPGEHPLGQWARVHRPRAAEVAGEGGNGNVIHRAGQPLGERLECLNGEIFYSLKEAQIVIEQWRVQYNTIVTAIRERLNKRSAIGCKRQSNVWKRSVKLIIRKANAGLSVASGGEAPVVVKKAEASLFMRDSTPSAQTQRVRVRFIGLLEGSFSDSDLGRTPPQLRISQKEILRLDIRA
jgi:hypothetical protein